MFCYNYYDLAYLSGKRPHSKTEIERPKMKSIKNNRQIAIGDIHGCYDLLKDLLEYQIKFDPKTDELIFLGDYIDRGTDSEKVVTYLGKLQRILF